MKLTAEEKETYQRLIDELESPSKPLTSWEMDFLNTVQEHLHERGSLSEKQIATLNKIYEEKVHGS